jgi:ribosomal protein S18 acetylase RimI-like enzyme
MPDFVIVDYSTEYADELVQMWRKSFEQAVGISDPHPLADQLRALEEKIVPEHRVRLVLDKETMAVIGFLASTPNIVSHLYVHVEYQNKGIGSRLLNLAKQESDGSLRLFTLKSNTNAQRFYESQGFRVVGRGFEEFWQLEDIEYEWCKTFS